MQHPLERLFQETDDVPEITKERRRHGRGGFLLSVVFPSSLVLGGRNMGEVIVITSGKGGVGKTTTTANIGAGLAKLGKKVLVIDTDLGLRNLDVVMGLENRIVYNLVDVIEGRCRLKQAAIHDK